MRKTLFFTLAILINLSSYALSLSNASSQFSNDTIIVLKKNFDTAFFIPDGPRCPSQCYRTGIIVDTFPQGAVIGNAQEIASLCMTMEHSFAGDLGITLICPNGQKTVLMTYNGAPTPPGGTPTRNPNSGADFGLPVHHRQVPGMPAPDACTDRYNAQGIGWQYCWSERYLTNTQGLVGPHTRGVRIDSSDYENRSKFFTPDSSFNSLVGCPLNGEWVIEVCDYWAMDKGWLFEWSLALSMPASIPEGFSVTNITQNQASITCENNSSKAFVFEYKKEAETEWISKIVFNSQIELTSLDPSTVYQIRAYSYLGDGLTKLETEIQRFKTVCNIPNIIVGTVTKNSAIITFENESGNEFGFQYKKEGETEWIFQATSTNQIELADLDPDTKYFVRTFCTSLDNNEIDIDDAITKSFVTKALNLNGVVSQETMFEIYPNPAKDFITIKSKGISGKITIEILDMNGACLQTQNVNCQANEKDHTISLEKLPKGMYFARIQYNNKITIKKLVIQ